MNQFYCPHCKARQEKPDPLYSMAELARRENRLVLTDIDIPETIACKKCGRDLNTKQVLEGLYDVTQQTMGIILLSMPVSILVLKFLAGWSWVPALLIGLFGGALAGSFLAMIFQRGNDKV